MVSPLLFLTAEDAVSAEVVLVLDHEDTKVDEGHEGCCVFETRRGVGFWIYGMGGRVHGMVVSCTLGILLLPGRGRIRETRNARRETRDARRETRDVGPLLHGHGWLALRGGVPRRNW